MNMHDVSKLDIEKFRKVHALIVKGATAGERSEPHRLGRRPQLVRSRGYDKQDDEQIFS